MSTHAVLVLLCLLSLCGCATQTQWTKPGGTQEEWVRDREACRREASRTVFAGKKKYLLMHSPTFYAERLEEKGYVKEPGS